MAIETPPPQFSDISERGRMLLKTLVERYISDGQPVGSRTLSRSPEVDLSPASIRNVMADLEEMGLVVSPHTSAGRVPTVQGYRLFVDHLLTVKPLQRVQMQAMRSELASQGEPERVLARASSLLSEITSMAGVVMVPRREHIALRQVEFLPLSNNQVLVILVINEREVQNRVIQTSRQYTPAELQRAANYINHEFGGLEVDAIRRHLVRDMRETQERMNDLMIAAVEMANKAFSEEREPSQDYLLAGETNLMGYSEMADVERLRDLFEAFNRKRDLLHLLDQSLKAQGVQIFIGSESGHEVLESCSVVTQTYRSEDDEVLGVLGVIGPTRMAYDRVIPIVDVTARLLGAALKPSH